MMPNYRAWLVQPEDFPKESTLKEKLSFLIRFAVLAPSSHNSQPWQFFVQDNVITVLPNLGRKLSESDTNNRQLYISLGCAIENILTAADYYGFHVTLNYLPQGRANDLAAELIFSEWKNTSFQTKKDHLVWSLLRRTTNRNPYKKEPPTQEFLERMSQFSQEGLSIEFVQDETKKHRIAEVVIQAGIAAMEDRSFRRELSQYVKSNITRSGVGIPAFGMGIPTPVSLVVPFLVKYMNMNKLNKVSDKKLLTQNTPVFGIILTREDTKEYWIKAGQLYERIAILAEKSELSNAIMAAPIQIGEFFKELQEIVSTSLRPQVFFRLGYATSIPHHSPRLETKEVFTTIESHELVH